MRLSKLFVKAAGTPAFPTLLLSSGLLLSSFSVHCRNCPPLILCFVSVLYLPLHFLVFLTLPYSINFFLLFTLSLSLLMRYATICSRNFFSLSLLMRYPTICPRNFSIYDFQNIKLYLWARKLV